jgi:hypothetical protein
MNLVSMDISHGVGQRRSISDKRAVLCDGWLMLVKTLAIKGF